MRKEAHCSIAIIFKHKTHSVCKVESWNHIWFRAKNDCTRMQNRNAWPIIFFKETSRTIQTDVLLYLTLTKFHHQKKKKCKYKTKKNDPAAHQCVKAVKKASWVTVSRSPMSLPLCVLPQKKEKKPMVQSNKVSHQFPHVVYPYSLVMNYWLPSSSCLFSAQICHSCLQGKEGKVIRGVRECFIKVIITLPSAHHSQTASIMQTDPTQERPELRVNTWPEC